MQKYLISFLFLTSFSLFAQKATIHNEVMSLKTYPFSDPDPVPILSDNPIIYPYHKFDGYSHIGVEKEWNVVVLENKFIKLFVLPEVGGKIWGAIDKSNGQEYIYRNEVIKFRNIAMRGPWTSGGIEFNFGVIGHHPSTATPADYSLEERNDGSVVCTVGNIDLPSRTHWRVNIILPSDKAYFITEANWYNPTPFEQAYYNWMTGAAFAQDDLTIYAPGNQYLDHGGGTHPYPLDKEGRDLSRYAENKFGPSKSYHVVGEFNDFFGGYFEKDDYGFGHWSAYEDMPGQKVWLWALSRAGGIWEDLLTDTDGQYIEFQAGRMLNQYFPEKSKINPTSKASFSGGTFDKWKEIWFPVNGIGGISDASDKGALYVSGTKDGWELGINSFASQHYNILVSTGENIIFEDLISSEPMAPVIRTIAHDTSAVIVIDIPELGLSWSNKDTSGSLKKKYESSIPDSLLSSSNEYRFYLAEQAYFSRFYDKAEQLFQECLKLDPLHMRASSRLAELYTREAKYEEALKYVEKSLSINNYDSYANYIAGLIYNMKSDEANAMEAFSWALRDIKYRSTAFYQMAELKMKLQKRSEALDYVKKSISAGPQNIRAMALLTTILRHSNKTDEARAAIHSLLEKDPLNHHGKMEAYLLSKDDRLKKEYLLSHKSEFDYQTILELIVFYDCIGDHKAALEVIELYNGEALMIRLWEAKINERVSTLEKISFQDIDFVFPYRTESLIILEWAMENHPSWKYQYLLALNSLALRQKKGYDLLENIGNGPQSSTFYLSRAELLKGDSLYDQEDDLLRARELSDSWRIDLALAIYYLQDKNYEESIKHSKNGMAIAPQNNALAFSALKGLLKMERYEESLSILKEIRVLPFEGASEGRLLYEISHAGRAIQLMNNNLYNEALIVLKKGLLWDESLGVGKPYEPDERLFNYLLAKCYAHLGSKSKEDSHLSMVADYTNNHLKSNSPVSLLGLEVCQKRGFLKESEKIFSVNKDKDWMEILKNPNAEYDNDDILLNVVVAAFLQK